MLNGILIFDGSMNAYNFKFKTLLLAKHEALQKKTENSATQCELNGKNVYEEKSFLLMMCHSKPSFWMRLHFHSFDAGFLLLVVIYSWTLVDYFN
jgi:hypothetical protein